MAKTTKTAKRIIASQIKVAASALQEIEAAVKTRQMNVIEMATKRLLAANDAAEAAAKQAGVELTEAQLKGLGYVKSLGGTWGIRTAEDAHQENRNKRMWRKVPASLRQERDRLHTTIASLKWVDPKNPDNYDPDRYHDRLRRPVTKALLAACKKAEAVDKKIFASLDEAEKTTK